MTLKLRPTRLSRDLDRNDWSITGKNARVYDYHIAGKTGTAKKVLPGGGGYTLSEYYASFGGFGPLRDPRLVGYVVLDTPRGGYFYGGQVAAPVFERIVADAFAYLRVPPDDDPWEARRDELKAKPKGAAAARKIGRATRTRRQDVTPTLLVTCPGGPRPARQGRRDAVAGLVRGYRTRVDGRRRGARQCPGLAAGQACASLATLSSSSRTEARARSREAAAGATGDPSRERLRPPARAAVTSRVVLLLSDAGVVARTAGERPAVTGSAWTLAASRPACSSPSVAPGGRHPARRR
jgi:hypothetical protein